MILHESGTRKHGIVYQEGHCTIRLFLAIELALLKPVGLIMRQSFFHLGTRRGILIRRREQKRCKHSKPSSTQPQFKEGLSKNEGGIEEAVRQ